VYRHKYDIERRKRSAAFRRGCALQEEEEEQTHLVAQKKRERERVVVKKEEEEEEDVSWTFGGWWWKIIIIIIMTTMMEDGVVAFATARVERVIDLRAYLLHHASSSTGLPRGTILFSMALVLGLPLGMLFRLVSKHTHSRPSSSSFVFGGRSAAAVSRTAMALIGGTTMSLMTFGTSTYHAFYVALPSVLLLKACATYGKRKGVGVVTFLWSFGYLVWVHYDADSGSEWKRGNIDITGLLMVLTLKVTSSAMNFEDYGLDDAEKSSFMKRHELAEAPKTLEYLAWCMFPCTLVSGPTVEFKTFRMWLREEGIFDPDSPRNKLTHYTRWPRTWMVLTIQRFIGAMICLALHLYLAGIVSLQEVMANGNEWEMMSLWEKLKTVYIVGAAGKYKYYFVWMFADASSAACGLAYNGINAEKSVTGREGPEQWNGMTNIHPFGVDFANTFAEIPSHWNIRTGIWLRHYCYDRIHRFRVRTSGKKNRKAGPVELLLTQLVSGIWHGLSAGYWMFFSSTALIIYSSRRTYKWQRDYMSERFVKYWRMFSLVMTHVGLIYLTPAFHLVEFKETLRAWNGMYWFVHIFSIASIALTILVRPERWKKRKKDFAASKKEK
tara:strand:- start:842 stop:2671 length:1830 start_codon:yes stop_codon:yes gene_type:complete